VPNDAAALVPLGTLQLGPTLLQFADGLVDSTELLVTCNNLACLAVGLRERGEVPHNIEHMRWAECARYKDLLATQSRTGARPHGLRPLLCFAEGQGRASAAGFLWPYGREGVCRFCHLRWWRNKPQLLSDSGHWHR
jgi:hypothetical protein